MSELQGDAELAAAVLGQPEKRGGEKEREKCCERRRRTVSLQHYDTMLTESLSLSAWLLLNASKVTTVLMLLTANQINNTEAGGRGGREQDIKKRGERWRTTTVRQ